MRSIRNITIVALCLVTLSNAQCTASTTDCRQCDGDTVTCVSNPNCRMLTGSDVNPNLIGAGTTQVCVAIGSCDSDCTVCPDTAAGCSDGGTGSAANCVIAGAGPNAGTCVGASCGVDCESCGTQPVCAASAAEPNGCSWTSGVEVCVQQAVATPAPTTDGPTTESPTTPAPTTPAPTTPAPTTPAPTTPAPTTPAPTTPAPTTPAPTTTAAPTAPTTGTWWTGTTSTGSGGSSSSGSGSSSGVWSGSKSWSLSSSSSWGSSWGGSSGSGWSASSSSEVVAADDANAMKEMMSRWTARAAARANAEEKKTWSSVADHDLQTTKSDQDEDEMVEQVGVGEVEWSVGKTTMINLWGMLLVCLCGNAIICFVSNRGNNKKRQTVTFHHDEHEARI